MKSKLVLMQELKKRVVGREIRRQCREEWSVSGAENKRDRQSKQGRLEGIGTERGGEGGRPIGTLFAAKDETTQVWGRKKARFVGRVSGGVKKRERGDQDVQASKCFRPTTLRGTAVWSKKHTYRMVARKPKGNEGRILRAGVGWSPGRGVN